MSSEAAIRAEGLSKAYLIYREPRDRLRQAVMPRVNRLLRRLGLPRQDRAYYAEHWALRDLSFEVARGETLAVIGRNGSGKSTLLQLICGTLTPTTGQVVTQGRVAALLELGSGFNPEYTGRENVLLNASVLGLSREETLARMADILAFADIGEFVDQPVKTYSSGMAMRLAFAVIAHVDADVLIVDEALAVGDAMFQQKCFRWLRGFQERGTLLFCGHDMGAVVNLCQRAIWLDRGRVRMMGAAQEVAEAYGVFVARESMGLADAPAETVEPAPAPSAPPELVPLAGRDSFGSGLVRITHAGLALAGGPARLWFQGGETLELTLRLEASAPVDGLILGYTLKDRLGQAVAGGNTLALVGAPSLDARPGVPWLARLRFDLPRLAPGDYALACAVASGTQAQHVQHHWVHEALVLELRPQTAVGALVNAAPTALHVELCG
jgi:lipopolysaccharide transport system ATP-binding protein